MPPLQPSASSVRSLPLHEPHRDDIERLGEQIAELAAQIHAATYQLLVMIREFDEREGWDGFASCAHWLNWRAGIGLGAAREKVRVARALSGLPRLSAEMEKGLLSYSKVRALTRVATEATEEELLEFARAGTAAHVEKLVRAWRRVGRLAEAELEERRHQSRGLQAWVDEDGMVVVRGRLTPEAGAALMKALQAAGEKLYRAADEERRGEISAEQRRADALGLVAESALAGGLDPGTRGDRYQVVVHVEAAALRAGSEEGQSVMEGLHVSAETSRRLACDSAHVVMTHAPDGSILDVGRRTRTIPPALRRALAARDGGCRFPGCGLKLCEAHHVEHWADGGATKLDNLLELCRRHHRAVHEEGYRVELVDGGEAVFRRPDGRLIPHAPPSLAVEDPLRGMLERVAGAGVTIDPAAVPTWDGGACDYGWAVEWFRQPRASRARGGTGDDGRRLSAAGSAPR